jgi:hypothetical protein
LLIGAWRVWSRLSFCLAVCVVAVATPFVAPVVYALHYFGWFDRD